MELIQSHPSVLTLKTDRRDSKGIEILIMSDVHFDNPHCDRDLLKKHLDQAKQKGAYVICIGDFFCAMEGRYDPRRSKGTIRPEYNRANYIDCIVNDAIKFLKPYKENLLFFSLGNHETSVLKNVETDLLERMIGGLGGNVKKLGYLGYFIINTHYDGARIQKYRIFFHHGKWGGVITKGSLAAVRYASISNADLIVSGHTHDHWSMPHAYYDVDGAGQLKVKELDVIKCGTYKEEFESGSGFGPERIVMPKMKRQWWLKLFWTTKDITDVQLTEAR